MTGTERRNAELLRPGSSLNKCSAAQQPSPETSKRHRTLKRVYGGTLMRKITLLFAAAAICCGLTVTAASAMPIAPIAPDPAAKIEQVRWVCGPYGRCWWRPNYYRGYGAYAYYPRRHYWHRRYW